LLFFWYMVKNPPPRTDKHGTRSITATNPKIIPKKPPPRPTPPRYPKKNKSKKKPPPDKAINLDPKLSLKR